MKNKFSALLLLFILSIPFAKAQETSLVVVINVENMRPDYLQRYKYNFGDKGFNYLIKNGALCSNAQMNLYSQNSSAATATLFTGSYPNQHGIVNANWVNSLNKKEVNAIYDNTAQVVGTSSNIGRSSARKLLAPTVGDEIKLLSNGKSLVYSVALEPSTAVLSAGHAADGAFWMDDASGKMVSSSYYISKFPSWVGTFNMRRNYERYMQREWDFLYQSAFNYPASEEDESEHEEGYPNYKNNFPYDMDKLEEIYGNYSALKHTPWGNALITEFSNALIDNEYLGKDKTVDFISVNYNSLQSGFGPQSVEMEDFYIRLDKAIANLLEHIDERVGLDKTLVVLTTNTADSYSTSYLESLGIPTGTVKPENITALLRSFLNITYKEGNWVLETIDQEVYLNHKLIEERGVDLDEIRAKSAEFISQFEGVSEAISASQLSNINLAAGVQQDFTNSYKSQRSGDVLFSINPGWHIYYRMDGSQSNDKRIALLFMGNRVKAGKFNQRVDAIDLVPTLMNLLDYSPPSHSKGDVIDEIIK